MNFSKQFEKAFIPLETPNPAEVAFKVSLNYKEFTAASLPVVGSAYSAWANKDPLKISAWGTYVFVRMKTENDLLWFFWMKPKTAAEMLVAFETVPSTEPKPWPPMLRNVRCKVNNNIPLSAMQLVNGVETLTTAPRNFVTVDYVPEAEEGGRVLVKRYYGPTVHEIPAHEAPIATSVNWDIPGAQDFYRKCLHPDIAVYVTDEGAIILVGAKAKQYRNFPGAEFFPATNFLVWRSYTFSDVQEQDFIGGWLRTRKIAIPPKVPEVIIDKL